MTRQTTVLFCLFSLFLVGCLGDSAEITKAKSIIKKDLIDGESAQFTDLRYYKISNYVCGEVNAKNKLGGYVGKKMVAVDLTDPSSFLDPDREIPKAPSAPSYASMSSTLDYLMRSTEWQKKVAVIRERGELFDLLVKNKCTENPPKQEKTTIEATQKQPISFDYTNDVTQVPPEYKGTDFSSVLPKVKESLKEKNPIETTDEFHKRMSVISFDPTPLNFETLYSVKLDQQHDLFKKYNADKEELKYEIEDICTDVRIFRYKNEKPLLCELNNGIRFSISSKNKMFGKYFIGKVKPYLDREDYKFTDTIKIKREVIPSLYSNQTTKDKILIDVLIVGNLVKDQKNPKHTWIDNSWNDNKKETEHAVGNSVVPFEPKFIVYYNSNTGEILQKRALN
jgi:hypothetical protein